jgi:hypothetical protein
MILPTTSRIKMTIIFRHDKPNAAGLHVPARALRGLETLADEGALLGYDGETLAMLTDYRITSVATLFTAQFHSTAQAKTAQTFIRERFAKKLTVHVQPIFATVDELNNYATAAHLTGFRLTNGREPHTISIQSLAQQPTKTIRSNRFIFQ